MDQYRVILRPDNSDIDEQYVGSGPTLLAALGDLDRQVFEMSGESLLDDANLEANEMLATLIAGAPYKRVEMGGDNFTMWKEVSSVAVADGNVAALPLARAVAENVGLTGLDDFKKQFCVPVPPPSASKGKS